MGGAEGASLSNKVLNTGGGGEEEKSSVARQMSLVFKECSWMESGRQKTKIFSPLLSSLPPSLFFSKSVGVENAYELPKRVTLPG